MISSSAYLSTYPYPHGIIDNYWDEALLDNILLEWPDLNDESIWQNKFQGVNKSRYRSYGGVNNLPPHARVLCDILHGREFISELEKMTGYPELISDPSLSQGAGMVHMPLGGVVPKHVDATSGHLGERVVNLFVYLSKDWEADTGGELELYDDAGEITVRYEPRYNRMLVFNSGNDTWHGVSSPRKKARKSVATYYFTRGERI